jgi:TfoX/Sxy family transcriptional regulator of competence genes
VAEKRKPEHKRKWRPSPEALVQLFGRVVDPIVGAERRKMFGYPCAFVNGQMFAGLHQEKMVLRLPVDERGEFLKLEGAEIFEPMPGRVMKEYVVVPQGLFGQPDQLTEWLIASFHYAQSLEPKTPRKPIRKKA